MTAAIGQLCMTSLAFVVVIDHTYVYDLKLVRHQFLQE